ncbi:MAG: HsdR family type I site-specific deoxyribonuclease [Gaiellales bacterium]
MSRHPYAESVVEEALLEWLRSLGYQVLHGPLIAPGEPASERETYRDVVLRGRLRAALERLNPGASRPALDVAERAVLRADSPSLLAANRRFHRLLVNGLEVEIPHPDGGVRGELLRLVDFERPDNNDWLAVNQLTVEEGRAPRRRPDVVVLVNGLPLAVVELKNPADEETTIWTAFRQLETYKVDIPELFAFNELLVVSDGVEARLGSLTAPREWFLPWRTVEGDVVAPPTDNQLEVLARGVFERSRFLDLVRHFVVFADESAGVAKKIAGYHQFHATRKAVETTIQASRPDGDRRAGVVWHTQGSGKSLTMAFYAGKLVLEPALANPTIVVITDRNDLDGQLHGVFASCAELLRQTPVQAESGEHLRELLQVASGGVVFTTIQKFLGEGEGRMRSGPYTDRRNVVVIADEAHRSQYGFIHGFARRMREALPGATFVAFTGTPVELEDKDTRSVFGDYIDVYDIQQAVADGATVPIYYESRLARLELLENEKPRVDEEFEEVTEGEEVARVEKLKSRWAKLEAVVGSEKRLGLVARDLVEHFENRLAVMDGKAMVVCMSRRICVELYRELAGLRPEWHADADGEGAIKVIMTGSASDPLAWQPHIRNKMRREALAERFKRADDPFRIVIVRDMWLTGFDAPSLHTMYVDKPMRGHGLMQAIARVNRVFRDKPGGLVVDYLGLADDLRKALAAYTEGGGHGRTALDQSEAVALALERHEVCVGMFHGYDYSLFLSGTPAERMALLPAAQEHVLAQEDGRERFVKAVVELSKAFALAVPREEVLAIRDEVAFFQTVKAALVKTEVARQRPEEELDHAVRQIVSGAIAPAGVIDVFAAAGLEKPDLSLLSPEFLAEVRELPQKNLAVELLRKLLGDEIRTRARKNLVQSRAFSELLEAAVRRYQSRAIEAAQVIEELIEIAKEMREAQLRGEELGLTDEELAFYDALETNDSAVAVLGDEALRAIARELVDTVHRNATIDWTVKENVRANLRRMVRRILRKHGYPPDRQERATQTVLEQAELLGFEWATAEPAVEVAPFRALAPHEARPFVNCIPLYALAVAAGEFGQAQAPEPEAWVAVDGITPAPGLFVAQVVGESMNRRIPNGAYCVFRAPVAGSRQGRVVLVQHREISDPETGGQYTVKIYESTKTVGGDGWQHAEIRLLPDTAAPGYEPIVLSAIDEGDVRVVAELVGVLD